MAKSVALIVSALCLFAFVNFAQCQQVFNVEGKVYCDTCRVQFETRISENIPGATVRLECRERNGGKLTYSIEGVTDANGKYSLLVEGDHEEDICEVTVIKSPKEDCNESMGELKRARVLCTSNSGVVADVRYANPLGFMKKESLSNCKDVINEFGFLPIIY